MNTDALKPANYEYGKWVVGGMGPGVKLAMFCLIGLNGFGLWALIPQPWGTVLAAPFAVVAGLGLAGLAWRTFEIHVLGLDPGRNVGGESE